MYGSRHHRRAVACVSTAQLAAVSTSRIRVLDPAEEELAAHRGPEARTGLAPVRGPVREQAAEPVRALLRVVVR